MVSCFLRENLCEVSVFWQEGDFGFCLFSGDGKFHYHSELGNKQRVGEELFTITTKDPVDLAIVQGVLKVLILCVMVKVVIESRVIDGVYIDVFVGTRRGLLEEGVVLLCINSMGGVKILRLVTGFRNSVKC